MNDSLIRNGVVSALCLLATSGAYASDGCGLTAENGKSVNGSELWPAVQTNNALYHSPCDIAQFSWNNFLYLMQSDAGGHPRFMSLAPWYDVVPAAGKPVWTGQYSPLSTTQLNKVDNQGQAGDGFHLLDVAGGTTAYDMRVNKVFFDYVSNHGLYTHAGLDAAASAFQANPESDGIWLPPNSVEQGSSIEIKTAWREFGAGGKCPSSIMHCETDAGGNEWGLVGIHLVQKTQKHGEMIWATFEHVANAPDCTPGYSNPIQLAAVNPRSALPPVNVNMNIPDMANKTGWSYFNYADYKAQGGDGQSCSYPTASSTGSTQCLGNPSPSSDKTSWSQVNVCRTSPLPRATSAVCGNTSDAMSMVSCLNNSFGKAFPAGYGNKWKYYILIGNETTNWPASGSPGAPTTGCWEFKEGTGPANAIKCPKSVKGESLVTPQGDSHLANATMETWMQKSISLQTATGKVTATDCFSCHQPTTTTWGQGDMSHLFDRITQAGTTGDKK